MPTFGATLCFWLAVAVSHFSVLNAATQDYSFGKSYNWVSLNEAFQKSKSLGKPVMVVIHRSWCPACKFLAPIFSESGPIHDMSDKVIMVSLMDQEEPSHAPFCPDGCYTPRIIFFDGDQRVLNVLSGNPTHKFYYGDDVTVAKSMARASVLMQQS